jgi:hypothetical protein
MSLVKQRDFLFKEKMMSIGDEVNITNTVKEDSGLFKGKILKFGNTQRLFEAEDRDVERFLWVQCIASGLRGAVSRPSTRE